MESAVHTHTANLTSGRTTQDLATLVVETPYDAIPTDVVDATKRLILDAIVVTAAACGTDVAQALMRLKADRGGSPEATLIVDGRKVPVASAAYVHGQLSNLLDADETMHNRMHAVSPCVMSALAVAEATGASGSELIAAVATGYEISARIGKSLRHWVSREDGGLVFAPLVGFSWMTMGAAAAAGRLLGLSSAELAMALGQAFVTTPVYFDYVRGYERAKKADEYRAAWHKYEMAGPCTAAGVEAALLISYGWVAEDDVFDDGRDFWRSFAAPGCDFDEIYSDLGTRWHVTETSIKRYPSCRAGHAGLDILAKIMADAGLGAADIESLVVRIPPHQLYERLMETVEAAEPLALMLSQPSALALVALRVPPAQWFGADLASEDIRSVAHRIGYEVVPEWGDIVSEQIKADGYVARLPTEIVVYTRDGRVYRGYAEFAQGDPWTSDTAFSDDKVADKARQFLDSVLPADRIEALIAAVGGVDASPDLSAVTSAFVR